MDVREKPSNEKRLIDAAAFIEKMKRTSRYFDVVFYVEEMPTIDAVEVVRCKDCMFGIHFGDMEDEWIQCMNLHGNPLMPFEGFCSYGERMEGADNDCKKKEGADNG